VTGRVEQAWVALLDGSRWRRFGKSPAGRRILRSGAYRVVDNARRYAETAVRQARNPRMFAEVRTLCLFLGTVKSGGTLIGALLDAHPRMVVSDEADPLRYVCARFGRDQIFHILTKNARREAMKGRVTARRIEPYSVAVPGQSQGRVYRPLVVGDSRAGPTIRRLGEEPGIIDRMRAVLGDVDDRYIHVVRNPYDPISAMVRRGRRTISDAIADYTAQSARMVMLRELLGDDRLLTVRYEDFVTEPAYELRRVCRFLGIDPTPDYLTACAAIVDANRRPERETVEWPADAVAAVQRLINQFGFLDGYRYAD
jgi:hypothetical protein